MNNLKDTRTLTIAELEKILIEHYGKNNESRGCYLNGKWFSIDEILELVSNNI